MVARPFLLVTRRAIPAKSRLHNASDNRVDQRMPKNKVAQQIIQEKAVVL
jgi:tRNA A37 threonylcarbamoyladenosine synthetase subunit TsaC/SUA5/YrdC